MGNKPFTMTKQDRIIGYESVNSRNYTLITTLSEGDCFIKNTLTPNEEVIKPIILSKYIFISTVEGWINLLFSLNKNKPFLYR